jgi:hypothetical protein
VRVVCPGDFSIAPHADTAYGHAAASFNFYIPLTPICGQNGSSAALFLESRPGAEDWRPVTGDYGRTVRCFAGGLCLHWTAENQTAHTRVSLDVRCLPAALFDSNAHAGLGRAFIGDKPGYFARCRKPRGVVGGGVVEGRVAASAGEPTGCWERVGPLLPPDERNGFPFSEKRWRRAD